jgi:hypothetical protein
MQTVETRDCSVLVDPMTYVSLHVIVIFILQFDVMEVTAVPIEYYLSLLVAGAIFC